MYPLSSDLRTSLKLTKIIATLGPASRNLIKEMLDSGLSILRINLSHIKDKLDLIQILEEIRAFRKQQVELFFGVAIDTRGPEIRLHLKEPLNVKKDDILLFANKSGVKDCIGYFEHPNINDIEVSSRIIIDDGALTVVVISKNPDFIETISEGNHFVNSNKGIAFPGLSINMPYLNEKDMDDILTSLEYNIDFIFASFVSKSNDIVDLRKFVLDDKIYCPLIIAKIESKLGIENLESILSDADGIMVARGDMAAEVPIGDLYSVQKKIIKQCKLVKKPVIIATEMLESMIKNDFPTRAEITDVSYATDEGVDCVMLSAESAIGKHPDLCVSLMKDIIIGNENRARINDNFIAEMSINQNLNVFRNAKAVVFFGNNMRSLKKAYALGLNVPIIFAGMDTFLLRQVSLYRGMIPHRLNVKTYNGDVLYRQRIIDEMVFVCKTKFGFEVDDVIVFYMEVSEMEETYSRIVI